MRTVSQVGSRLASPRPGSVSSTNIVTISSFGPRTRHLALEEISH